MHHEIHEEKKKYLPALATALLILLTLLSVNQMRLLFTASEPNGTITIEGEGRATSEPDKATLQLGVRTEAETVLSAQTLHATSTSTLIQAVKDAGVPEKDIQTQNYYMRENRFWDQDEQDYIKRGWMITESVEVIVNDIDLLDAIISTAGANGVTDISGPTFEISETYDFEADARANAIKNAEEKAKELSKELGVRLGAVVEYSEWMQGDDQFQPYYAETQSARLDEDLGLQRGEEEIVMQVYITYQIR